MLYLTVTLVLSVVRVIALPVASVRMFVAVGFSSSTFVMVCVIVSVAVFPPASEAVTVTVLVLEPKLKSL